MSTKIKRDGDFLIVTAWNGETLLAARSFFHDQPDAHCYLEGLRRGMAVALGVSESTIAHSADYSE